MRPLANRTLDRPVFDVVAAADGLEGADRGVQRFVDVPPGPGFPTRGRGRCDVCAAEEAGNFNFGNERESENAPLAERCFPTLGLFTPLS
jgi:hypothetical protein